MKIWLRFKVVTSQLDYLTPYGIEMTVMRTMTYPTRINLKEIQEEGSQYHYNRQSGEMNATLQDLIQDQEYKVELHVKPMGNVFEISGQIQTCLPGQCSRCGRDAKHPVNDNFSELIIVMAEKPRAGHSGHTGGLHEDGPFCNYLKSYAMDLSEFVREHIAATEPYTMNCGLSDCEDLFQKLQNHTAIQPVKVEPFSILKNFSVRDQRD